MLSDEELTKKADELCRILSNEIKKYWDENKEIPIGNLFSMTNLTISNLVAAATYHFLKNVENEAYPGDKKYFLCVDTLSSVAKGMLPYISDQHYFD